MRSRRQMARRKKWANLLYSRDGCRCWSCGRTPWGRLEIHEIERRSQAPRTWAHDCNYMLVCNACHMNDMATMPHAEQLARKMIIDPKHYDLKTWLTLRSGGGPDRVTQEEVDTAAGGLSWLKQRFNRRLKK